MKILIPSRGVSARFTKAMSTSAAQSRRGQFVNQTSQEPSRAQYITKDATTLSPPRASLTALPFDKTSTPPITSTSPAQKQNPGHVNNSISEHDARAEDRKKRYEMHLQWYRKVSEIRYDTCIPAANKHSLVEILHIDWR